MAEPLYTCCEDGMLSQVPPTDNSGLCPACHRSPQHSTPIKKATMAAELTKADTVALWHAVQWMALCLKQNDQFPSDALATERERLAAAKRALRKVNAIRKASLPKGVKEVHRDQP